MGMPKTRGCPKRCDSGIRKEDCKTTRPWGRGFPIIMLSTRRLRVVPHLSSGIVKQAKRERAWKSPHARKGDMGWFSRALAFRSLYCPWGKRGRLLVVYSTRKHLTIVYMGDPGFQVEKRRSLHKPCKNMEAVQLQVNVSFGIKTRRRFQGRVRTIF